jgi:RND family efflux transporter MFP subunit
MAEGGGAITTGPHGRAADSPGPEGERVAFLSQALWKRLRDARAPEEFSAAWLALQTRLVEEVIGGVVVLGPPERGPFRPAAGLPDGQPVSPRLLAAAERALTERRGVAQTSAEEGAALAFPLLVDDRLHGVAGLLVRADSREVVRRRMRELQWGAQALEYALFRSGTVRDLSTGERLRQAHELLAGVVSEPRFEAAALALATEIADALPADRVAIGFRERGRIVVRALSHSAQFGKRMNLVRAIATAMDEAADHMSVVLHPLPEGAAEGQLDAAHRALAELSGVAAVLTIPFCNQERVIGALLLERKEGSFAPNEIEAVEYIGDTAGPVLDDKRRNDQWLVTKAGYAALAQVTRLFGSQYYGRKLAALILVAIVAFFAVAKGADRVTAEAALEGTIQRVVISAFDGYLQSEHVRAGDVVRAGEVLARLDSRDLELERARRLAERSEIALEHAKALALGERAQANILLQQDAQVAAQIGLIEEQIARSTVVAPFDGIVVRGDLSQQVGGAVRRGDELFTIAPLDSYRIILRVNETRLADVASGQGGRLLLTALPNEILPLTIERLTPVAEARDGATSFRVEASVDEPSLRLRPGMEGIAKIDVGERHLIAIWTRGLLDWLTLAVWRYVP